MRSLALDFEEQSEEVEGLQTTWVAMCPSQWKGGAGRGAAKGGATAGGEEGRLLLERAGAGVPALGPKEVKESKDD